MSDVPNHVKRPGFKELAYSLTASLTGKEEHKLHLQTVWTQLPK